MNIFKSIFFSESLKGKIIRIENEIKQLVMLVCKEKFWIEKYGAYDIDPKNLVFWICVQTDKVKKELENNSNLENDIKFLLDKYNYPKSARKHLHIGFESQETVNRESQGDWYLHFK